MPVALLIVQSLLIGLAYWVLLGKYIPGKPPSYLRSVVGAALLGAWSFLISGYFLGLSWAMSQPLARGNPIIGLFAGNAILGLYILTAWLIGGYYLMRNVFAIPRGHGALLIVYLVLSAIVQGLWRALF